MSNLSKQLLNLIAKNIYKANNFDLSLKINSRKIYVDSKIFDEDTMVLVFLLDTQSWFQQTLRFEVKINTMDSNIYYKKGYGENFNVCEKLDYKKVVLYVLKEVFEITKLNTPIELELRKIV